MSGCCRCIMSFYWEFKGEIVGSMGAAGEGISGPWYLSGCAGVIGLIRSRCDWASPKARCMQTPPTPNTVAWVLRPYLAIWKEIMLCIKLQPALGMQSVSALDRLTKSIPGGHSKTLTIGLARVLTK